MPRKKLPSTGTKVTLTERKVDKTGPETAPVAGPAPEPETIAIAGEVYQRHYLSTLMPNEAEDKILFLMDSIRDAGQKYPISLFGDADSDRPNVVVDGWQRLIAISRLRIEGHSIEPLFDYVSFPGDEVIVSLARRDLSASDRVEITYRVYKWRDEQQTGIGELGRKVTVREIAREAGVGKSTAARVMNRVDEDDKVPPSAAASDGWCEADKELENGLCQGDHPDESRDDADTPEPDSDPEPDDKAGEDAVEHRQTRTEKLEMQVDALTDERNTLLEKLSDRDEELSIMRESAESDGNIETIKGFDTLRKRLEVCRTSKDELRRRFNDLQRKYDFACRRIRELEGKA